MPTGDVDAGGTEAPAPAPPAQVPVGADPAAMIAQLAQQQALMQSQIQALVGHVTANPKANSDTLSIPDQVKTEMSKDKGFGFKAGTNEAFIFEQFRSVALHVDSALSLLKKEGSTDDDKKRSIDFLSACKSQVDDQVNDVVTAELSRREFGQSGGWRLVNDMKSTRLQDFAGVEVYERAKKIAKKASGDRLQETLASIGALKAQIKELKTNPRNPKAKAKKPRPSKAERSAKKGDPAPSAASQAGTAAPSGSPFTAPAGSCHICGDPGHWSPNCPQRQPSNKAPKGGKGKSSDATPGSGSG